MTNNSLTQIVSDFKAAHPALTGRIDRGAALATTAGGVIELAWNNWQVASRSGGRPHVVTFAGRWSCDCPDCNGTGYHPAPVVEFCGGVGPVCQHVVAACLRWLANEEIERAFYDAYIAELRSQAPSPAPVPPADAFVNDLGYTDEQLSAPPSSEYKRILAQARRRETALPSWAAARASIDELLG